MTVFIRLFILTALLGVGDLCYAQTATERIDSLIKADRYEIALTEAEDAIEKGKPTDQLATLKKLKADALYYLNEKQASTQAYIQAAKTELATSNPRQAFISLCYGEAGYLLQSMGVIDKALGYHLVAKKYALSSGDLSQMATVYSNLGVTYEALGNYDQALVHLDSAYKIDKQLGDSLGVSYDLNNIGYLLVIWKKYEEALKYYKQSLEIAEALGKKDLIAIRYNNIGMAYLLQGLLEEAEVNVTKSLALHQAMNDSVRAAKRLTNLGEIQAKKKSYNKAIELKMEALELFSSVQNPLLLIQGHNSLAQTLDKAGFEQKATNQYFEAVNLGKKYSLYTDLGKSYKGLSDVYKELKQYKEALFYQTKYIEVKDSIYTESSNALIQEMQVKYDVEQKEAQIALLNANNELAAAQLDKKQRLQYGILTVVMIVGAFVLYMITAKRKQYKLKEELLVKEIDELRARINSIVNTSGVLQNNAKIVYEKLNTYLTNPLSQRELDIVELISTDMTNREIANQIFVSVNTVKFHLKNIYEKLNVNNREQAMQAVLLASHKN